MGSPASNLLWFIVGLSLLAAIPTYYTLFQTIPKRQTSDAALDAKSSLPTRIKATKEELEPYRKPSMTFLESLTLPQNHSSHPQRKYRDQTDAPMQTVSEDPSTDREKSILAPLLKRFPRMNTRPIPRSRWETVDNTTCVEFSENATKWRHRLPSALIIGAQKGGSSSLAEYLHQHPSVVHTRKELHFLSERMDEAAVNHTNGMAQRVQRKKFREYIKNSYLPAATSPARHHYRNPQIIDATPIYLTMSDRVPQRVLCLCPWAKLVVLLRNPVDRAHSQYNMEVSWKRDSIAHGEGNRMPTLPPFDDWLNEDYEVLKHLGILPEDGKTHPASFYGSATEREAWKTYTKLGLGMPIGRGLYALQLRHWQQAYTQHNVSFDLLAIHSDDLKKNPGTTFREVLRHLNLPAFTPNSFEEHHKRGYESIRPMSNSTRAFLESIFEPYNRQLMELLGSNWEDVWQPQAATGQ